jgi:hypothetical protein
MGKPQIISADNEIINAFYERGQMYKEFEGITLFRTNAHELNKNAIVERMIRTLKQYLIKIFLTDTIDELHSEFLKFRMKIQVVHKMNITFVDYILEFACEINNNKEHRTIQAIPEKVFDGLETNKQKVNYMYYPLYPPETIVIKRPESKGAFSNRVFNFDPEPYVVLAKRGRKFRLAKLIDYIEGGASVYTSKEYQPYEIRAFKSAQEILKYLNTDLIKNSLIKLYGEYKYNVLIKWVRENADRYNFWISNFI